MWGPWTEIAMNPDNVSRIDTLTSQLSESLMTAAICAQEIHAIVRAELDDVHTDVGHDIAGLTFSGSRQRQRPLLDESTLSVIWKGRTLHLGHTLAFRLLARLARRPNQYVTHLDLLHDVWDDEELATATVRSLVRRLRLKLQDGGMSDLAAAIRGHNGRYILDL
jgi:DNA-binding response OmpR family regulator